MNRLKQIEAFLGVWEVKTKGMREEEIHSMAKKVFEVSAFGYEELAEKIEALGKTKRRELAVKNLPEYGIFLFQKLKAGNVTEKAIEKMMQESKPNLVSGEDMGVRGDLDIDPAALLGKVVTAIINYGHQDVLWEFPELLSYFGSRIPNREEVAHMHGIDERMFAAKEKWPNLIKNS